MFVTRLISGIILVAAALVTIITGGVVLWAVLLAVSLIGMHELFQATGVEKKGQLSMPACMAYAGAAVYYCLIVNFEGVWSMAAVIGTLVAVMMVYVFTYPKYRIEQISISFFGIVYVAVMLSCIYLTRRLTDGAFAVWLIFLCSWGCDTCAYCVGMLFGKHKMSPKLSPKKSIEGAVGGVVGAALLGGMYAAVVGGKLQAEGNQILVYASICAAGALISMVGDLAASAIKRNFDIKDYGKLIPGHGGILDRFDSVIFTAPVIYYLALLMIR